MVLLWRRESARTPQNSKVLNMTTLTVIVCGLIIVAAIAFIIFFIVSNKDKDVLDALSIRAKQIDPLTGVQMPENPGNFDTPDTMVLAEDMEIAAAVDDDD